MNQSNVIFAYLLIAFIIFITMRGELRTYMGFFFGGGSSPVAPGQPKSDTATNNSTDLATQGLSTAIKLAPLVL